ncbi:MAG TPA: hypothetical protein VNS22_26370 [Geminicoccus sp.]|uniref:hypothetical protein n=1 Tax=Geminicoccus sp. TaxID=2024832 RepID=UPI002B80EB1A|nr:hypothetical protein [Geminicoccus sp.]HWL71886.1 hypothetical protein [Geminicoccus sp.]
MSDERKITGQRDDRPARSPDAMHERMLRHLRERIYTESATAGRAAMPDRVARLPSVADREHGLELSSHRL